MDLTRLLESSQIGCTEKGDKLTINGSPVGKSELANFLPDLIEDPEEKVKIMEMIVDSKRYYRTAVSESYNEILAQYTKAKDKEIFDRAEERHPGITSLEPVVDKLTSDVHMCHKEDHTLDPNLNYYAFQKMAPRKHLASIDQEGMRGAIFKFKPMGPPSWEDNGELYINTYQEQRWRSKEPQGEPVVFIKFLKFLVSRSSIQVKYSLGFLYTLLTGRNQTAMIMNGAKGIGKTLLYEIAATLVGGDYSARPTKNFGQKEFNGLLCNNILLGWEEHEITQVKYNFIKGCFSDQINIEAKGRDIGKSIDIFANHIFCNNSAADYYLEGNERRFSVLDLATEPLESHLSEEEINHLRFDLQDPNSQAVADLGHWLLKWGEENEVPEGGFAPYMGQKYREICELHQSPLISAILLILDVSEGDIEYITRDDVMERSVRNAGILVDAKTASPARAKSLIESYKYQETYKLGIVTTGPNSWSLKVDKTVKDIIAKEAEAKERQ